MKHYRRNASLLLLSLSALLPISAAGLQTETTTRTPDPKQQVIDLERQARRRLSNATPSSQNVP